jgi:hypothetical protein
MASVYTYAPGCTSKVRFVLVLPMWIAVHDAHRITTKAQRLAETPALVVLMVNIAASAL